MYEYKGYSPYGAAEQLFIDGFVGDDFNGNATEFLIKSKKATFHIVDDKNAFLRIFYNNHKGDFYNSKINKSYDDVDFIKR